MEEFQNEHQLLHYLKQYQLESVFHEPLRPHMTLCHFEKCELICREGETSEYLYVLVEGKVKIFTTSPQDKTLVLCFKTPLEVVGDIEYVRESNIVNTVQAVSPVVMLRIHYQWLAELASDYAPLLKFLLQIISHKFYIDSNFSNFNLMYPVEVRLASYLLSISTEEAGTVVHEELDAFNLTDIANLIGTSYRHLNRVIQKLCADGLIMRDQGFIMVKDRAGLAEVAGHNIYE
ncbi:cyclic nucleotide-binding domain-containing protein [Paenibacillus taichungensis]|uniref:Cyclic nucleotide-binding domain-containing protein n=1 Tax=Paenibacillus taichungensis TaxID=484184 RepID=A0ABX2MQL5_9BACL|nr:MULTISPECIES: cyclic nucleotide-binding domain-containing protein [Paenibacillus]OME78866.1 Crp/Fnr family transcriptional regulator [Paenibacillus pabuli]MEC0106040.1 cyclic nucleotide-binding domain-containing protein [Paenibacillus taichungensis]MEC0196729.1 cyclic nucleotide-binding domain-containing protein [Paenibacillus taichungensis]NUU56367.1 cyclic nucleotide-binding domain-containing protein [Paenibacillus taichungensis]PIH60802.1 Crp/Fnr family transcriptional regulator [Paeniba